MPRVSRRAQALRAVSRVTLMIILMSLLMGLTPSPASAVEKATEANAPKLLPEGVTLPKQPDNSDTSPKAFPIEPSKASPAVQAWTPQKELIEKRTASSRTFAGAKPGQFETRLYSDAVNFKKGSEWAEIDANLTPVAGGKLKNKANSFGLELAGYSDADALALMRGNVSGSVRS